MISLSWAWLRSRGFHLAMIGCAIVALSGALASGVTLRLPFLRHPLPLPVLAVLVTVLVVTTSLQARFAVVERTLLRVRLDRAVAGIVACGLAGASCLPAGLATSRAVPWNLLVALMTVATVAVVLLGPMAWLTPLVIGLACLYADLRYHHVVSHALDDLGGPVLTAALVVSLAAFVRFGPRSS